MASCAVLGDSRVLLGLRYWMFWLPYDTRSDAAESQSERLHNDVQIRLSHRMLKAIKSLDLNSPLPYQP